jgi:glucose-1-phosphate cytidylyltransferase
MKAIILAGGLGTRLSEETELKPKPLVKIGQMPILWHIMKIYSTYGVNDFIICCGYKGYLIKEYFANYSLHMSNVTFNLKNNIMTVHKNNSEEWTVTLVDTGLNSMTGGRLLRVHEFIKDEDLFCFTYGDGLSDVNISKLIEFHNSHGKEATLTAFRPVARYGVLKLDDREEMVNHFEEKPDSDRGWINGGFFVLSPKILERIEGDSISWEKEPLSGLAKDKELVAFKHYGFWQPMDTLRDKVLLNELWNNDKAPWKIW